MLVFSHGGLNAARIDMALEAKARGLKVVTVSSHANVKIGKRSHSSGKILSEVADVAIDNHVPPEDALVDVGQLERVAAGSTVAAVSIAMTPRRRDGRRAGHRRARCRRPSSRRTSAGVPPGHMAGVYQAFTEFYYARPFKARRKACRPAMGADDASDRAAASGVARLQFSAWAGMFVFGIVMAILGRILPSLFERIGFGAGAAGNLFLTMNFAMLDHDAGSSGPSSTASASRPSWPFRPLLVAAAFLAPLAGLDLRPRPRRGGRPRPRRRRPSTAGPTP